VRLRRRVSIVVHHVDAGTWEDGESPFIPGKNVYGVSSKAGNIASDKEFISPRPITAGGAGSHACGEIWLRGRARTWKNERPDRVKCAQTDSEIDGRPSREAARPLAFFFDEVSNDFGVGSVTNCGLRAGVFFSRIVFDNTFVDDDRFHRSNRGGGGRFSSGGDPPGPRRGPARVARLP